MAVSEAVRRYLAAIEGEGSDRTGLPRAASTIRATRIWLDGLVRAHGEQPLADVTTTEIRQVIDATSVKSLFEWA